jgi:hypothetical protein
MPMIRNFLGADLESERRGKDVVQFVQNCDTVTDDENEKGGDAMGTYHLVLMVESTHLTAS